MTPDSIELVLLLGILGSRVAPYFHELTCAFGSRFQRRLNANPTRLNWRKLYVRGIWVNLRCTNPSCRGSIKQYWVKATIAALNL